MHGGVIYVGRREVHAKVLWDLASQVNPYTTLAAVGLFRVKSSLLKHLANIFTRTSSISLRFTFNLALFFKEFRGYVSCVFMSRSRVIGYGIVATFYCTKNKTEKYS